MFECSGHVYEIYSRYLTSLYVYCAHGSRLYICNPMDKKCKLYIDSAILLMMNWNAHGQCNSKLPIFFLV